MEDRPLGVHVRDHAADVTDDCSEYEHADEECLRTRTRRHAPVAAIDTFNYHSARLSNDKLL